MLLIVHFLVVIKAMGNSLFFNAVQGFATENMQMTQTNRMVGSGLY
jgi:hypothetical protein